MSSQDADLPVWRLVQGHEWRAPVLAGFGIDYCCGGRTPLRRACAQRGVSIQEVLGALEASDDSQPIADHIDWSSQSLTRLTNHIVSRHHAYLRDMLPRLGTLLDQVIAKHADKYPSLVELREVYTSIWSELLDHMMKEELVLFPCIRLLDQSLEAGQPVPRFPCGSVTAPIQAMEDEHHAVGEALLRMRELTFGFRPPQDACQSYRVLFAGLRELESDLHQHIHKENNILFPRSAAVEASQTAARAMPTATGS